MASSATRSAKPALSVFLISLLGIPATYVVNTAQTLHGELGLFIAGVGSLCIICLLTYFALASFKQPKDWLFYGMQIIDFPVIVYHCAATWHESSRTHNT